MDGKLLGLKFMGDSALLYNTTYSATITVTELVASETMQQQFKLYWKVTS